MSQSIEYECRQRKLSLVDQSKHVVVANKYLMNR